MIETVYCLECDELVQVELLERTKFAKRVARHKHADDLHGGNMSIYRVSLNSGMSGGEWKHLQEFLDAHPELELSKLLNTEAGA